MRTMSDADANGILDAILNLHAFTELGFGTLDRKIDSKIESLDRKIDALGARLDAKIDGKIDSLRYDMNKRFDRVDERFDRLEMRVGRLENDRL